MKWIFSADTFSQPVMSFFIYINKGMLTVRFIKPLSIVILVGLIAIVFVAISIWYNLLHNTKLADKGYKKNISFPTYPAIDYNNKTKTEIEQIKRGEYLTKAGDCIACHTNPANVKQPFSGNLRIQTSFGVIYSPNITPDKETGIGGWTNDQFIRAFRDGISPRGEYYFPAFPFLYFQKLSTSDLLAIKSYLDNIPAVKLEKKDNELVWPFNWRFLQLGWRILFFYSNDRGAYQADTKQSPQWNRGAYLVEGPGHCSMCHTPSYYLFKPDVTLGAPINKYYLTGAVIEGYLAPNITQSNLEAIPDETILKIFTEYRSIGGGQVEGPMYEAIHDSLKWLSSSDLLAMITYLKSVKSTLPPVPSLEKTAIGKSIYDNYCSACHRYGVAGAPRVGDTATWKVLYQSGKDKLYFVAIHGVGMMPPKGMCKNCSDADIKHAVDYMILRSIQPKKENTQ